MKYKYLIFILILIPMVYSIGICQDEQAVTDLPCSVISPKAEGYCGVYNYTVTRDSDAVNVEVGNMSPLGDMTYNFTFNHTKIDGYSIVFCENSTASINVIRGDNTRYLYLFVMLIVGGLFALGAYLNEPIFTLLAGFLICVFSIYALMNGLIDFENDMVEKAFFFITIGLGFYFIGTSAYKLATGGW